MGNYNCLRREIQVERGSLVLLSPNAHYDFQRHQSARNWETYWAAFHADVTWIELLNWPEACSGVFHLHCEEEDEMDAPEWLFRQLVAETGKRPFNDRLRRNLVEQILLRCQRLMPEGHSTSVDGRVRSAMEFIGERFSEDFTLEAVAKAAHTSVPTLSRLFREQTGLTVLAWREEQRLTAACQKLNQTRLQLSEIASQVGYEDPLYFSRVFRKRLGCSPSEYRNRYLAGN